MRQRSSRSRHRRQPSTKPSPAPLPDAPRTATEPPTPTPSAVHRSLPMRLRVCSHPNHTPRSHLFAGHATSPVSPRHAVDLLTRATHTQYHEFWPCTVSVLDAKVIDP